MKKSKGGNSLSKISQKKFKKSFRGYNRDKVDEFLAEVAKDYKKLLEENRTLSEEVKKLKREIEDYHSQQEKLKETLISVQKSTQLIEKTARERANLIIKEAKLKADKTIKENETKLEKLREEIIHLGSQKRLLLSKLRSIIETHSELLKFYEDESTEEIIIPKKKKQSLSSKTPLPHSSAKNDEERIVLEEE
ncbi:MAG: DivIVA domain-containing protein [Candidatus Aerophobetes bacterium]|nr:DivIVA domain-containing protein [Candidatus Aerophobetes bacterium]